MKIVSLTSRQFKRMPGLQLSDKIISTEARLYYYTHKQEWHRKKELMKIYYNQNSQYLSDKIYIISQLLANADCLGIPELVIPSALLSIDGEICGLTMPYIENNLNLSLLLNNPKVKLEVKIMYLKEILKLLNKVGNIKELEGKFFLGDIHEANFILDVDEQIVKAVDMDSAYFMGGYIPISKYLTFNEKLYNNPEKYPFDLENNRVIPTDNTMILCYLYMVLNALSGEQVYRWDEEKFYIYLEYLIRKGLSHEVVDIFSKMYTPAKWDRLEPEFLDEIDISKPYVLKKH